MGRPLAWTIVVAALALPATGSAEDRSATRAPDGTALPGARTFIRVDRPDLPVPEPGVAHAPPSRILYINDCKPNGCLITPGDRDDSRLDQSQILEFPHTLSAFNGSAAEWDAIIACVRENYAPFQIRVVTDDPGDVPHFEGYAAGLGTDLGFTGVLGVASVTCGLIPNAVSFSFLNDWPADPARVVDDACWTVSQETGHNLGLLHSMLATDAMTYLPNPSRKRFVNEQACVGTQGCCQPEGECRCGMTTQNSYERMLFTFGAAGATAPDIWIDEPGNGAIVRPGFPVKATVTDWDGVTLVELLVDDVVVTSRSEPPFDFQTPTALAAGTRKVTIRATDGLGLIGQVNIMVDVDPPCLDDQACATVGNGLACVDGECVPAPPAEGGGCDGGGGATTVALGAGLLASALVTRRRRRRAC